MTPATIAQAKATQRGCLEAGVAAEQAEQVLSQFVAHPAFEQAGAHLLRLQQVRSSQHMLTAAASCVCSNAQGFWHSCELCMPPCSPSMLASYIHLETCTYICIEYMLPAGCGDCRAVQSYAAIPLASQQSLAAAEDGAGRQFGGYQRPSPEGLCCCAVGLAGGRSPGCGPPPCVMRLRSLALCRHPSSAMATLR